MNLLSYDQFLVILRKEFSHELYIPKEIAFYIYDEYLKDTLPKVKQKIHKEISNIMTLFVLDRKRQGYFVKVYSCTSFYEVLYHNNFLDLIQQFTSKKYQGMCVSGAYALLLDHFYEFHPLLRLVVVHQDQFQMFYAHGDREACFYIAGIYRIFNDFFNK